MTTATKLDMTTTADAARPRRAFSLTRLADLLERLRQLAHDPQAGELDAALDYLRQGEMRVGQAQKQLNVKSPTTIKNWIRDGRFPGAHRGPGGQWLLPVSEVMSLLDASRAAQAMSASGRVTQKVHQGDPYADLDL